MVWHLSLPLMNSFNKTEAAVFLFRPCFLRASLSSVWFDRDNNRGQQRFILTSYFIGNEYIYYMNDKLRALCKTVVTCYITLGNYNSFAPIPRYILFAIRLNSNLTSVTCHHKILAISKTPAILTNNNSSL